MNVRQSKRFWGGALCGLLFLLLGCLFVDRAGLQEDESMFAAPLFREWSFYSIPFGRGHIPIMQMSYVGSLKTWLYAPFLQILTPGPAVLRIPAVLIGAVTILLFGALLERVHGRRAAWAGCVLLATDSIFLLTTTFDWGPVALQHLLMTAAMFFAVVWFQKGSDPWLAAMGLCCGLAFWDKAVFVWMFSGLLAGSLLFIHRLRKRLTSRSAGLSAAALCLGALPLLIYNVTSSPKFTTIRSNSEFEPVHFRYKLDILRRAWNGSGLFGYMLYDSAEDPAPPRTLPEKVSFALHGVTGDRRTNASELAFLLGIVLVALLWRTPARNTLLLPIIACGFSWIFMTLSGGGTSAHHAVLLWPLPSFSWRLPLPSHRCTFVWAHGRSRRRWFSWLWPTLRSRISTYFNSCATDRRAAGRTQFTRSRPEYAVHPHPRSCRSIGAWRLRLASSTGTTHQCGSSPIPSCLPAKRHLRDKPICSCYPMTKRSGWNILPGMRRRSASTIES